MLLAIDSSTQWMGICLYDGSHIVGEIVWQTKNHHTVELTNSIELLLERCGVEIESLEALAVASGPGSFTSLRIGMSVVKGISLALHIPVISVPTLDILAFAQCPDERPMAVVLQAGRRRWALGWYAYSEGKWTASGEPIVTTAEEFVSNLREPVAICGELSVTDRKVLEKQKKQLKIIPPAFSLRRPSMLAEIAWLRLQINDYDDVPSLAPYYLHVAGSIPV